MSGATDADREWLASRVHELGEDHGRMAVGDIRSRSRSFMEARQRGDESPELLASALALGREALRRTVGLPDMDTVVVAVQAVAGLAPVPPSRTDGRSALAMALYWHGLAGRGVHVMAWDDDRARSLRDFFEPVAAVLGCPTEPVTRAVTGRARRAAYDAMITFGSYVELADDYLRDHLHTSPADVVQRGLYAAVVDDLDAMMGARSLSSVMVLAPRSGLPPRGPDPGTLAAALRRRRDYDVDREQGRVVFTKVGMSRLKTAAGWGRVPQPGAVATAERVENIIAAREGVGRPDGHDVLAEISVQGYLRSYPRVSGLCLDGRPDATLDEVVMSRMPTAWHRRELAFEQLIDHYRADLYAYRDMARDEPDPLRLVRPLVAEAVRAWEAGGPGALAAGFRDVLGGRRTDEEIQRAAAHPAPHAASFVEETIERRTTELGPALAAALVRMVIVEVIGIEWRRYLLWMGFLRRQGGALYDQAGMIEQRAADVTALFTACRQAVRASSIRHILELEPRPADGRP